MNSVKCKRCGNKVSQDYFYKNKRTKGGKVTWEYRPECKDCSKAKVAAIRNLKKGKKMKGKECNI